MTDELQDLIDRLEPSLAAAFSRAVVNLRAGINFAALLLALRNGDIDAAIYALNIDRGAFSGYGVERQTGYVQAGEIVSAGLTRSRAAAYRIPPAPSLRAPVPPTGRIPDSGIPALPAPPVPAPVRPLPTASGPAIPPGVPPPAAPTLSAPGGASITFRFDMTNPRAEAKIRTEAAARVAGYVDEQIETARRVIGDGFARGQGPQTIATDIAGRINPISGRREGGIVGLSDPQVDYVENMRRRLLSGDPDEMIKVLGRFDRGGKWIKGTGQTLRDRRYDRSIQKAIRDVSKGKVNPLTGDKIDEMAAKYSDRLLARRAEDIARTETAQGVEMARAEATKQALEKSGLPDEAVTKTWVHQGGIRHARDPHLAMNGKIAIGTEPFFLPDGSVMLYPHDPAGGVKNNANCRCRGDQAIDWAYGL